MIKLKRGWFEWDWQIGTFRGSYDGIIYGEYTAKYLTPEDLNIAIGDKLTSSQISRLNEEKQFHEDLKQQQEDEAKQWAQ